MSLSRPEETRLQSPVAKFINYHGTQGIFQKKAKGEKYTDVGKELKFIVIDDSMVKISGWDQAEQTAYNSNMVRTSRLDKDILKVKADMREEKRTVQLISGLYADIKKSLPRNAKYTRSLYLYDTKAKEYCLWDVSGSQLTGYFGHLKEIGTGSLVGRLVLINDHVTEEEGVVRFVYPVFTSRELKKEEDKLREQLTEWDSTMLQPYLDEKQLRPEITEEQEDKGIPKEHAMPSSEPPNLDGVEDDLDLPF